MYLIYTAEEDISREQGKKIDIARYESLNPALPIGGANFALISNFFFITRFVNILIMHYICTLYIVMISSVFAQGALSKHSQAMEQHFMKI